MSSLKRKLPIIIENYKWMYSQVALLHEQTKLSEASFLKVLPRIQEYLSSIHCLQETARNYKVYAEDQVITLPEIEASDTDFASILKKRRSLQDFSGHKCSLQELSNLLGWSCGVTQSLEMTEEELADEQLHLRTYPSAGGLYPCETYLIAININELNAGIYHYDAIKHQLNPTQSPATTPEIKRAFINSDNVDNACGIIITTSIFERTTTKYKERGYRFALLEAGHIAQNILLSATALNLKSLPWGGYYDDELAQILNIDTRNELPLHTVFFGKEI